MFKAESHECFILNPLQWSMEAKLRKLGHCPNTYGPNGKQFSLDWRTQYGNASQKWSSKKWSIIQCPGQINRIRNNNIIYIFNLPFKLITDNYRVLLFHWLNSFSPFSWQKRMHLYSGEMEICFFFFSLLVPTVATTLIVLHVSKIGTVVILAHS